MTKRCMTNTRHIPLYASLLSLYYTEEELPLSEEAAEILSMVIFAPVWQKGSLVARFVSEGTFCKNRNTKTSNRKLAGGPVVVKGFV